ncbi:hypothetical protein TSOC_012407, partial [Tetrabaena socialis]
RQALGSAVQTLCEACLAPQRALRHGRWGPPAAAAAPDPAAAAAPAAPADAAPALAQVVHDCVVHQHLAQHGAEHAHLGEEGSNTSPPSAGDGRYTTASSVGSAVTS